LFNVLGLAHTLCTTTRSNVCYVAYVVIEKRIARNERRQPLTVGIPMPTECESRTMSQDITQKDIDDVMSMFGNFIKLYHGNARLTEISGDVKIEQGVSTVSNPLGSTEWKVEVWSEEARIVFRHKLRDDSRLTIHKRYTYTFNNGVWRQEAYTHVRDNSDGYTFINIWQYIHNGAEWVVTQHISQNNVEPDLY